MRITTFMGILSMASALGTAPSKGSLDIVGGTDAIEGEIPYQISLRENGRHVCGGSFTKIHNQHVVITAAHCVQNSNASNLTVVGGELDRLNRSGREQRRQVTRYVTHPQYGRFSDGTLVYDIALLLIDSPFKVNQYVSPIALPRRGQQTSGQVVISGWGDTYIGDNLSRNLQKVQIPVVDDDTCQKAYSDRTILGSMLCAGLFGEGGKDSCHGDSGGPVRSLQGNYLAGVVSWAYECANGSHPGVNTQVSYFIDWLEAQID